MTKTYTRRTPEQIVAELEAKIEQVKARAAAKEAKATPEGNALLGAVKAVDKAIKIAEMDGNEDLLRSLEAGRAPLAEQMIKMGVRLSSRNRHEVRRSA